MRFDRFGEFTLLEKLAGALRAEVAHMVVVPEDAPLDQALRNKLGEGVEVAEPCPEPSFPAAALGQAHRLFPAAIDVIAVLTSGLPYLEVSHVMQMFDDLPPRADGVCVTVGEEKHPLLGVYSREVLKRAHGLGQHPDADGAAPWERLWEGLRIHPIPAPEVPGGPTGLTIASGLDSAHAYRDALTHHGFCDPAHPAITLELFGNLRIRTGCGTLPLRADKVGTAFRVFRAVYPETARLLPEHDALPEHFRFSIDGGEVTTNLDHPLKENDQLILFSATVGG